jgi:sulfate adenylyltransferase (ADP) / ATP adenylyltransferase
MMGSRLLLKSGSLWGRIVGTSEKALRTGSQSPVPTDYEFIDDAGIRFFVRVLSSLRDKDEDMQKQREASASGKRTNPFLPYDKALYVAEISDSHVALLNKFNVVNHHLLIITRHFESQDSLLTLRDFEALRTCMAEYNSLGFYNGGEEAGASQSHKHLQVVPLPLAPEGPETPIDPLLDSAYLQDGLGTVPGFPFLHSFARLGEAGASPLQIAAESFRLYCSMLTQVGLHAPGPKGAETPSKPYCFLAARKWMLLVPRSKEFFDSISINSLGFAGALLVRDSQQLDLLKSYGPMAALKSVALPA